jgi:hypothetical protein
VGLCGYLRIKGKKSVSRVIFWQILPNPPYLIKLPHKPFWGKPARKRQGPGTGHALVRLVSLVFLNFQDLNENNPRLYRVDSFAWEKVRKPEVIRPAQVLQLLIAGQYPG